MSEPHTQEFFRRVAVLLLSLAELAEMAGRRSDPARALVLWILGFAEAAARRMADGCEPLVLDHPDEATRLATALRAYAAIFFALSEQFAPRFPPHRRIIPGILSHVRMNAIGVTLPAMRCRAPP